MGGVGRVLLVRVCRMVFVIGVFDCVLGLVVNVVWVVK